MVFIYEPDHFIVGRFRGIILELQKSLESNKLVMIKMMDQNVEHIYF